MTYSIISDAMTRHLAKIMHDAWNLLGIAQGSMRLRKHKKALKKIRRELVGILDS